MIRPTDGYYACVDAADFEELKCRKPRAGKRRSG
jgi:hypothetical protein